jgi:hypothetical protein
MGTGNDTVTSGCGFNKNGLEKVDMITSTRTCLQTLTDFHQSGHFSLSNNGLWIAQELADFTAQTACIASCLPANWATLSGYSYNDLQIINIDNGDIDRLAHHYSRVTGGRIIGRNLAWLSAFLEHGQSSTVISTKPYLLPSTQAT